jgi:ubiquinone/menaquinone biosynthesis C-methylase UbiE
VPKNWDKEKKDELFKYIYGGFTGWLQDLGHKQITRWLRSLKTSRRLELGIGQGHHLRQRSPRLRGYYGLDRSFHNLEITKHRFPRLNLLAADAQHLPFVNASFDRVIAIYLLEHLLNLERTLQEVQRVMASEGDFLVAVPAEGGWLYRIGRQLTTKRFMEAKFDIDYDAVIKASHLNQYPQILESLQIYFWIEKVAYLPFRFLPTHQLNAFVCIWARKK